MLPKSEIARRLRVIINDPTNIRRGGPTVTAVSNLCGWPSAEREMRCYAASRGHMTENSQALLSEVLTKIETGEITFRKAGPTGWAVEPVFNIDWNAPKRPQDRMVRRDDYVAKAPCRSCGNREFTPLTVHGGRWYGCRQCVPPNQWRALGAAYDRHGTAASYEEDGCRCALCYRVYREYKNRHWNAWAERKRNAKSQLAVPQPEVPQRVSQLRKGKPAL